MIHQRIRAGSRRAGIWHPGPILTARLLIGAALGIR